MQTFTFPSGAAVELPDDTPLCQSPKGSADCPAYNRAAAVHRQRAEVAVRESIVVRAETAGRGTANVAQWRDHHRQVLDLWLTRCISDPADCTC